MFSSTFLVYKRRRLESAGCEIGLPYTSVEELIPRHQLPILAHELKTRLWPLRLDTQVP